MILKKFALTDKVAIVTGGGKGIGRGIALGFAEVGANVVIADVDGAAAEATAAEIRDIGQRTLVMTADVRDSGQVAKVVEQTLQEFGRIDILLNNVGGTFIIPTLEMSENAWDALLRVNLKTVFLCSKAVARSMMEQRKGNIINIVSIESHKASPGVAAYGAAKAGIVNLTQSLAGEWGPYNIRVNAIAPGFIVTPGGARTWKTPEREAEILRAIPLKRTGQPEDIAGAAIYLASEASDYVSGQTIFVDGGLSAVPPVWLL